MNVTIMEGLVNWNRHHPGKKRKGEMEAAQDTLNRCYQINHVVKIACNVGLSVESLTFEM